MPKHPDITAQLSGEDGNGFMIVSRVRRALKSGGVSQEQIDSFTEEAMAGDYDHLLQTCMAWVVVK